MAKRHRSHKQRKETSQTKSSSPSKERGGRDERGRKKRAYDPLRKDVGRRDTAEIEEQRIDEKEWVYGVHPVEEWLSERADKIEELFLSSERKDQVVARMIRQANDEGVLIRHRPRTYFDRLFPQKNHQGIAIRCRQFAYAAFDDLIGQLDQGPIVFLTGIQDPGNLGAMIRSARAFGAHAILLSQRDSCPVNGTVIRASAGATASLPIALVRNASQAVKQLKEAGWWILGLALGGAPLAQFDLDRPAVFLLGEEGKGLKPSLQKNCDALLEIPMADGWDSLNVATCGAVVLYEWARQTGFAKS